MPQPLPSYKDGALDLKSQNGVLEYSVMGRLRRSNLGDEFAILCFIFTWFSAVAHPGGSNHDFVTKVRTDEFHVPVVENRNGIWFHHENSLSNIMV